MFVGTVTDKTYYEAQHIWDVGRLINGKVVFMSYGYFISDKEWQEYRVYGDEIPLADMDEYRKVEAIKKRYFEYPKNRLALLIMGLLEYMKKEDLE